jgi:penicillin-binding protein 2
MKRWVGVACVLALVLAACGPPPTPPLVAPPPTATSTPPSPDEVATSFFQAWQQGQYDRMYDLVSDSARATTPRDLFVRRYTNIHAGIGETQVTVRQVGSTMLQSDAGTARVPFQVTRSVAIFGDLTEQNELPLVRGVDGSWTVDWQPGLIFTQLTASSSVRVTPDSPTRGRILDRKGTPLADNGSVVSVGVVPGQVRDEAQMLSALSDTLGLPAASIKPRYQNGQPDWFMPIASRPESDKATLQEKLGSVAGVQLHDTPARVYPLADAAAHVVGYVGHPTADDLTRLASAGYDEADWLGLSGVEATFEQQLAGQKGGRLAIVDAAGRAVRTIAEKASVAGADVQLTLDADMQQQAASAVGDQIGSAIVMDPRDGSLLALVSRPSFDPNRFVAGLSDAEWQELNGGSQPLVVRATESAYATGSTFKVITMAAGIEKAGYKATDTFDCGLDWNGLPGVTLHNWQPQGRLNLVEALTESCNPAFYEIGLKLDQLDRSVLPGLARAFGLGQPTGLVGLGESAGNVPDPASLRSWTNGDAVNLAIGQGYLLATPLQLANAYAALADGGSLRSPLLVKGAAQKDLGRLPVSAGTRATILEGMRRVTSTPAGTAAYAFQGERTPIAAKTGSAENENPEAHAWFVGFATPDQPRLLVLAMVEGGEHGGTVAAPIARQLIDYAVANYTS